MLRQVDAAHAAAAEVPQQFVLAQEEALVASFHELVRLPGGDELFFDQRFGQAAGIVGELAAVFFTAFGNGRGQRLLVHQAAALDQFLQFFTTLGLGHTRDAKTGRRTKWDEPKPRNDAAPIIRRRLA